MKKSIILLTLIVGFALSFSSCSKDDKKFDYPMETLYGTWFSTAIKGSDGKWLDITSPIYADYWFSIKFMSDGTYYGMGYFGDGKGTYKAEKNMIYTYIEGKVFARYKIISMTDKRAELTMSMGDESIDIRVDKK